MRERWRPLVRGLLAVGRQVWRRRIRVALFGAVEFADLSDTDFRGAKDASGEVESGGVKHYTPGRGNFEAAKRRASIRSLSEKS